MTEHIFQLTSMNEGLDKIHNNGITMVKSAMSKEIYLSTLKHFDAVYFLEEITLKLGTIWWMQKLRTDMEWIITNSESVEVKAVPHVRPQEIPKTSAKGSLGYYK